MQDILIIHAGCFCISGGYVPDDIYDNYCDACGYLFGLNVPIVEDQGRMTEHLSCAIEREGVA